MPNDLIAPRQYNLSEEFEKFAVEKDKLALIYEGQDGSQEQVTYDELVRQANQLANGFLDAGLKKDDVVLVIMPRSIITYVVYTAALKAGVIVVPSSEMLRPKDLSYRFNHAKVKAVVAHKSLTDRVDGADGDYIKHKFTFGSQPPAGWVSMDSWFDDLSEAFVGPETSRDDTAFISYTSGTTGNPKGVVHTHGWGFAHLRTASKGWMGIDDGDKVWATAGPGWQKWIWSPFVSTLGSGATGFLYDGSFDPEKYLGLLERHKINVLCCTPTEYRLMAKVHHLERYHLTGLKSAVSAGEPLNREVIDTFQKYFGVNVRDGYGQTENTLLVGTLKGMEPKPGSMGKPTPGNLVETIREDGDAADVGEVGDIAVHKDTPALFKEYYRDEERTAKTFRGNYYITGDKAKKDKDGYLWFEGRGDDIIISSGYTIGPFEVEDALVKHQAVKECAVVSSPDPDRGNIVKAFVVLRDGKSAGNDALVKELQDHVKALTAPYKYPRKLEFVDDLPKTTSGKIRRIELRQKETESAAK